MKFCFLLSKYFRPDHHLTSASQPASGTSLSAGLNALSVAGGGIDGVGGIDHVVPRAVFLAQR